MYASLPCMHPLLRLTMHSLLHPPGPDPSSRLHTSPPGQAPASAPWRWLCSTPGPIMPSTPRARGGGLYRPFRRNIIATTSKVGSGSQIGPFGSIARPSLPQQEYLRHPMCLNCHPGNKGNPYASCRTSAVCLPARNHPFPGGATRASGIQARRGKSRLSVVAIGYPGSPLGPRWYTSCPLGLRP
jgi:hypothetical protein